MMDNNELTCVDCGGKFSLTDFGKELYEKNNMGVPRHCLQCSIVIAINKGETPKEIDKLVKTNSTFWTEDRINEYNTKLKELNNGLYSNIKNGKSR
jgi:hypothetical protein